ncbi:Alpha/Beta hydrolase protein [Pseudomassariella vexata]|uniref:Alpha/Beta hydrolase protein n=1 Tax=Pseudomassariella vexata TaxID=1141098 RepID=A0A1Y2DJX7_9PEZI|nr:Alpha/Beta hydrolase protein [Pseudomassariella vexata]ORY59521.1 Alpha/Beta hydrolase protein [Pseudomassariella vexata]
MSSITPNKLLVDYLTVDSSFGPVKGFIHKDYPHVAQFLGIPFAEAPVGSRRWLPPVPKASVEEEFNATEFGPSCPQWYKPGPPSVYNSLVTELQIRDEMSEDNCLSVSIWMPAKAAKDPTAKLPVIVWITGGAFLVGGSSIPYQNPTPWVENSQRHMVACINYRLTIFGFPNAAALAPDERNLGLLDQRLGLEWVHKHIASFGGDPSRLTHFGQSAGGRSIDMHAFQYKDNPLVRGLIINSGTALPHMNAVSDPEHKQFSFVAQILGFKGGSPAEELRFMRQQSAEKLLKTIEAHSYTKQAPFLNFRPIVDKVTMFDDYEELAKAGEFSKLDNGLPSLAPPATRETGWCRIVPTEWVLHLLQQQRGSQRISSYDRRWQWQTRSAHALTFRYLYKDFAPSGTSSFPNLSPRPWLRAYHSSDMPLIFGGHSWFRGPSTELEERVSRAWQELYITFAEDGPRGLRKLGWKDLSEGEGIVIGCGEKMWESVSLEDIDTLSFPSMG